MEPKHLVRVGYDALSFLYRQDDDTPINQTQWANQLVNILSTKPARVLDLGCGCGVPVARTLACAGHHVVGVDISAVQVARAKELVPEGQFFQADITELAAGACEAEVQSAVSSGERFDAVVALYVLIHLPLEEQAALMRQIGNWVKEGGHCMMTVGITAWTGEVQGWLGSSSDIRMWWSQAAVEEYRKWATDAGFEIVRDEQAPDLRTNQASEGHQFLLLRKLPSCH
ncbi:hypothetical protein HYDPIDRAFT_175417 [Hydnomerulius pinastri MD-312]|uniref:Methyltransferase domain-containing protein n=1 Tax=Hydnomerulius pinastri MD-312 TaxID=994086 RepID=A0A0C9WFS0_9AGAM|nr:hypothetical protein HYDPIDRAFT_175417 [Hydnomerulius pinastri MD-312]